MRSVLAKPEREKKKIIYHNTYQWLSEMQKTQVKKLMAIDELFYDTFLSKNEFHDDGDKEHANGDHFEIH